MVNNIITFRPEFNEGSSFGSFWTAIKNLASKVTDLIVTIFNCILPCFFKTQTVNPTVEPQNNQNGIAGREAVVVRLPEVNVPHRADRREEEIALQEEQLPQRPPLGLLPQEVEQGLENRAAAIQNVVQRELPNRVEGGVHPPLGLPRREEAEGAFQLGGARLNLPLARAVQQVAQGARDHLEIDLEADDPLDRNMRLRLWRRYANQNEPQQELGPRIGLDEERGRGIQNEVPFFEPGNMFGAHLHFDPLGAFPQAGVALGAEFPRLDEQIGERVGAQPRQRLAAADVLSDEEGEERELSGSEGEAQVRGPHRRRVQERYAASESENESGNEGENIRARQAVRFQQNRGGGALRPQRGRVHLRGRHG